YEILGALGRGAMGTVYKARRRADGQVVALKVLARQMPVAGGEARSLRRQAEALAALDHPGVVRLYDHGDHACPRCLARGFGGGGYVARELVEGGEVARVVDGPPVPVESAARLMEEVAAAVGYAHGRGAVHRDLKPSAVLLAAPTEDKDSFGRVKLSDFEWAG